MIPYDICLSLSEKSKNLKLNDYWIIGVEDRVEFLDDGREETSFDVRPANERHEMLQ